MISTLLGSWKIKVILLVVVALTSFYTGWKVNGWRHDAKQNKIAQEIAKQKAIQDKQDRVVISDLQTKKQEVTTKEVIRYVKIKEVTDDRVCFANWDAIRLWNDALSGQASMPTDSTRTTDSSGNASATDTEVLENLNTNAAKWERLREQMNAIIEWDKQTFGESE